MRLRAFLAAVLAVPAASFAPVAHAQETRAVSQCQAIAQAMPKAMFASFKPEPVLPVQAAGEDVTISYLGHSTFLIETPGGVSIATDYNGWHGPQTPPTVVTMNKAHSSHYTMSPDPAITHVLPGWGDGAPADHDLVVSDTYIRNVTTDIRAGYGGSMEADGNSIFIFEVAGLCIGHLGHLHHELDDGHYAEIGRLDVVMVPVDGGLTMGAESMSGVVTRLRSSLILPMHRRGPPITTFLAMFDDRFDTSYSQEASVTVSLRNLPRKPTILVLKGV